MLKHSEIIEKLNRLQKVALVASAFDAEPFENAGLPSVRIVALDELSKNAAMSYGSAVRSWNPELVGKMTANLIAQMGCKNNLFVTPDLKTTVNPSKEGLTEDAILNGEMGVEILRAAHNVGGAIGVCRPSVNCNETEYLDSNEDAEAINELFVKPFLRAVETNPCDAVFLNPSREGNGYYDTNRTLFNDVQNGLLGDDVFVVGEGENFTADAVNMLHGKITLGGCAIPLERAVRRYLQLKGYEAEGSIPAREVENALLDGSAIDDETLDELADRIIDFALTLDNADLYARQSESLSEASETTTPVETAAQETEQNGETVSEVAAENTENVTTQEAEQDDTIAENTPSTSAQSDFAAEVATQDGENVGPTAQNESVLADETPRVAVVAQSPSESFYPDQAANKKIVAESFVLLKNSKLLPLPKGANVAVIGEAYSDLTALKETFHVVGKAQGYDRTTQRSDSYIPAAVRATKNADAALVFLYPDDSDKLTLPANRIALLDALKKAHKRVIAVVCGDRPVDLSFNGTTDALFVAPADCPFAGEALADILCGNENPSGRLTRTYYDNADEYFRKYLSDKNAGVMRIGQFVGYRRYGIEKTKINYPFGFGLSYTKFAYSNLSITADGISFTLTNCGGFDGCEVAQVYLGAPSTTHVAPKKQLIAFRKVFLRRRESRKINIPLSSRDFETFDPTMYVGNVEAGEYMIYVGSSSLDIRLQGKKILEGVTREASKYKLADFTADGDYGDISRVNKESRVAKKGSEVPETLRILHKVALYAVPACALLFFLLLSVVIVSYSINYFLLSAFEQEIVEQSMFLAAIFVIVSLPIFGSLNRKRLVRIRNVAFILTPFLIAVCLLMYTIMFSNGSEEGEQIALNILTCLTVGAPITAVIAACIDKQLWRNKMGKNRWDKYYFEKERGGKTTSDEEFEKAMRAAEAAREAKAAEQNPGAPVVIVDVPQFYDKRLTYTQLLSDCKQFVKEYGVDVTEETLRSYIAALSSTQLIFVPSGGAALCQAVSEYFGRTTYIDNAEKYARFDDLFEKWQSGGFVKVPTNLSVALDKATKETAYLHTVLIRHVEKNLVKSLFRPIADVLSRKKIAFAVGEKSVSLPANVLIVVEIESDKAVLPEVIADVAALLVPNAKECEPAERRTIVQTVGFERLTAMCRTVRDDFPLDEEVWKEVDALDEHCKSAHIGNNLWNRMELHGSVVAACGGDKDEAIDSAMASELVPWLSTVWKDDVCEGTLPQALTEIFGEDKLIQSMALLTTADEEK